MSKFLKRVLWGLVGTPLFAQLPIVLESEPDSSGWHERSLSHDGLTRWYLMYRPTNLPTDAPVVFLLHGGGGSMRNNFRDTGGATREWAYLAEQEKVVLVAPNGVNWDTNDTYGDSQNWSDLRPDDSGIDDVGFLRKVIDEVVSEEQADPLKVYFTGLSNGGLMTYRVVMELGGRVAGAASFVADMPVDNELFQPLPRRVPILLSWGTDDPLMPYEGEAGKFRSAVDSVAWWVAMNGANASSATLTTYPDLNTTDGCRIHRTDYEAGPGGAPVVFWEVDGGGHTVPTIEHFGLAPPFLQRIVGPQCGDVEGVTEVWFFFESHSVPLEPKLQIEAAENVVDGVSVGLSFEGGHPGGEWVVEGSNSLAPDAVWVEMSEGSLGDVGEFGGVNLELPATKYFLRARSYPLGQAPD